MLRIKQQWRRCEGVKQKHQHANKQNERLQWDLPVRAHQQRTPCFIHGFGGKVALHLTLIGAEIRQHQERAAEDPRPERVRLRKIEGKIKHAEAAGGAGNRERVVKRNGHAHDEHYHDGEQRAHNDDHLLDIGPRDRRHPTNHRIDHRGDADQRHAPGDVPPEDGGQHHTGRGDNGAARHAAREQKQEARERTCFRVETLFQKLVRGVDLGAVQERNDGDAQNHHGDRQAEVKLYEAEAVGGALPRGANECHGRQLGGHDREPYRPPREATIGEEVPFDVGGATRSTQAVYHHHHKVQRHDGPINPVHQGAATR